MTRIVVKSYGKIEIFALNAQPAQHLNKFDSLQAKYFKAMQVDTVTVM